MARTCCTPGPTGDVMGGAAMATVAMRSTHVAMMVRDMVEQHLLAPGWVVFLIRRFLILIEVSEGLSASG
jgi:hypothetical protein